MLSRTDSFRHACLGPYLDSEVLNLKHPKPFPLQNLTLRHGVDIVGLDNVKELWSKGSGVQFRGEVLIEDIHWLSDTGREWLRKDLNRSPNRLTVERAIAKSALVVYIQAKLFCEPLYLRKLSTSSFLGLVVNSLHIDGSAKAYHVKSMEVYSFSLSRVFFSRWHALRVLEEMNDADAKLPPAEQTPPADRGEDWLLKGYIGLALSHHARESQRSGNTFKARKPHRSEAQHVFGRHATWLKGPIAKNKLLNLNYWESFILDTRKRVNGEQSESEEMDQPAASSRRRRTSEDLDERDGVHDDQSEGELHQPVSLYEDYRHTYKYTEVTPETPLPLEGYNYNGFDSLALPIELFSRPVLSAGLDWTCPCQQCDYYVNFLRLEESNLQDDDLLRNERYFVNARCWNSTDQDFIDIFEDIVERHYFRHLKDKRIKVEHCERRANEIWGDCKADDKITRITAKGTRKRPEYMNKKAVGRIIK